MGTHAANRFVCIVLAIDLIVGPLAPAQQDSGAPGNTPTTPTPQPASQGTGSTFNGPLSDYVPCIFSDDEQGTMRAQPPLQRPLNERTAQQLLDATTIALAQPLTAYSQDREFLNAFQTSYNGRLKVADLEGMTPEQAKTHIQSALVLAVEDAIKDAGGKAVKPDSQIHDEKIRAADTIFNTVAGAVSAEPTSSNLSTRIARGKSAILGATSADSKLSQNYLHAVAEQFATYATHPGDFLFQDQKYLARVARSAALDVQPEPYPPSAIDPSKALADLKAAIGASADIAVQKTTPKKYQPPEDVSCSMAVMNWKETRDIFGRRVANTYIAIQVNLRNLNTKNEFLVHDIQVAVDTGITQDYFGRFQAGRDKLLVRAVAQRGQSDDRRNVVLNTLQTVGAIAAASSLVGGTVEFKDAVAVFQGAFLTGFTNIFPDHTVEQLNHINDLVFSASNTSKVVVPVQGSVPLVTFISELPIEQLPFAWCGRLPHKGINPEQFLGWGADRNCNFNGGEHNPGYVTPYRYSKKGKQQPDTGQTDIKGYPVGPPVALKDPDGNALPIEDGLPPWDDLKYKDWRGAAVRMLQEHTFVVIGGVHIQEIVTQPKVTNIDCALLKSGQVDLSQTKDGMVTCSVTGGGLNLVSAIALKKGDSTISGKIKPATDGNSASLTFNPPDMCSSEGAYSLFLTYKSDAQKTPTDVDSGESVLLAKQPVPASVSFATGTLTVKGACLDQLNSASLGPQVTTEKPVDLTLDPSTDPKTATAKLPTAGAAAGAPSLKSKAVYYLIYTSKLQPDNKIKEESMTITAP